MRKDHPAFYDLLTEESPRLLQPLQQHDCCVYSGCRDAAISSTSEGYALVWSPGDWILDASATGLLSSVQGFLRGQRGVARAPERGLPTEGGAWLLGKGAFVSSPVGRR